MAGALRYAIAGLVISAAAGVLLAGGRAWFPEMIPATVLIALVALGPLLAAAAGWFRGMSLGGAAGAIDRSYRLHDRVTTAVSLAERGRGGPLVEMQLQDAVAQLERVDLRRVVPLRPTKTVYLAGGLLVLFVLACLLPGRASSPDSPRGPAAQGSGSAIDPDVLSSARSTAQPALRPTADSARSALSVEDHRLLDDYFQPVPPPAGESSGN